MAVNPLISILIPAYNEEASIKDCIDSLKKQNTTFPYEIIVIDNASTDKTAQIAKAQGVRVVHESQKGIYFARQKGLMSTDAKFVVFVDADSQLEESWIKKAMRFLQKHPDYVAVSSNFYFNDGHVVLKGILFLTLFMPTQISLFFLRLFRQPEFLFGNAYMARTKQLKAVGASSHDFPFYGDDLALSHRLAKKGKIRYLQTAFVGTSARRYLRLGVLKTLYRYGLVNTYIILGLYKKASLFSKKYS